MRRRRLVVALLALGLGLLGGAPRAEAVYQCGGVQDTCQCGGNNFCICCTDGSHGTDHGNCVWYGWHKACCEWGIALQWCTNAETWDTYATNNGYPVRLEPCANTVFVCEINTSQCGSGGYGHVGWVETAYPDGSIDVTEQGCYSWYGVTSRHINAQSASPAMHYIYKPGTSCSSCECAAGAQESQGCGNCGTRTRTCGSDCQWGSWSGCTGEGPCASGAQESQGCGNCGAQSRTCGSDCQWGGWSGCAGEGPCAVGASQGCGTCGGSQTCGSDCQWGGCVETCVDGALPPADAAAPPRDGAAGHDGATPAGDAAPPGIDAGTTAPRPDAGGPGIDGPLAFGGCQCDAAPGPGPGSGLLLLALSALLGWIRRRRTHR